VVDVELVAVVVVESLVVVAGIVVVVAATQVPQAKDQHNHNYNIQIIEKALRVVGGSGAR
jgi:hypothetical protein